MKKSAAIEEHRRRRLPGRAADFVEDPASSLGRVSSTMERERWLVFNAHGLGLNYIVKGGHQVAKVDVGFAASP